MRYAVVPLRQDVIAGVPLATTALVIAPDVTGAAVSLVPEGLRLRWRVDPACTHVEVERRAEGTGTGWPELVECEREELRDERLPAGSTRMRSAAVIRGRAVRRCGPGA